MSDSEVALFNLESDSGSETELEIDDDDSDVEPIQPAAVQDDAVNSEFDDSGSTVLLMSSNDQDIDSGSETDIEDVPAQPVFIRGQRSQENGGQRSQPNGGQMSQPNIVQRSQTNGGQRSQPVGPSSTVASHSQASMSQASQSERILQMYPGPSSVSQINSSERLIQGGAGPSRVSSTQPSSTTQPSSGANVFARRPLFAASGQAGPSHVSFSRQIQSCSINDFFSRPLFAANSQAGPSHMTAGMSTQRTPNLISQSQADLNQRQNSMNQSQDVNMDTNQSQSIPAQIATTSRNTPEQIVQSESRPTSSTSIQAAQVALIPREQELNEIDDEEEDPMEAEVLMLEDPSKNDSLKDFKSPKKPATKDSAEGDSDDDAETCIICYEPWTNSGLHRLASLKCGHLFGQSCIEKWLKGQGGKCPQCNAKAKKTDIRVIYAKALRMIDTTDKDRALKELEKEKSLRRKMELEAAQMNLKYQIAMEEVNRMKAQLLQEKARSQSSFSFGASSASAPGSSQAVGKENKGTNHGQYVLDKSIMISQNGGCRVLSFDEANFSLIASMPSPNQQLFAGFGVKKISAMDLRTMQYVPIHSKMIRDVTFNGRQDGLMLSASIDKTIKITSLTSSTVVQTYQTEVPAWSCAWNRDDVNYIYAGLQNGTIRIYDTRQTATEVETLNKDGSRCPIVSLNYVPGAPGTSFWSAGLLSGTLEGITFWEKMAAAEYLPQKQLDGNCTCLNFDMATRHCMASFRPNKSHPATRHVMCELKGNRIQRAEGDATQRALITCNPVQTLYGGTTMKLLTKSAMFAGPVGGQILVAAGDEASSSAYIWDANTGTKAQKLSVNSTVLDMCPFRFNRHHYMACLTDKQVKLYKWQGQPR